MDRTAEIQCKDHRRVAGNGDFDALFAQLDRPDASAPLDGGLNRLIYAMAFKQPRHDAR